MYGQIPPFWPKLWKILKNINFFMPLLLFYRKENVLSMTYKYDLLFLSMMDVLKNCFIFLICIPSYREIL